MIDVESRDQMKRGDEEEEEGEEEDHVHEQQMPETGLWCGPVSRSITGTSPVAPSVSEWADPSSSPPLHLLREGELQQGTMKKKISKEQRRREEQEKAMRVDLFLLLLHLPLPLLLHHDQLKMMKKTSTAAPLPLLLLPHLTIFVSYFYSQSEASVEHWKVLTYEEKNQQKHRNKKSSDEPSPLDDWHCNGSDQQQRWLE
jgi:hypothetical protein